MKTITVRGKVFYITDHALDRMAERNISLGLIKKALSKKPTLRNNTLNYRLNDPHICVCTDESTVVTVFKEDKDKTSRINRKLNRLTKEKIRKRYY